MKGLVSCICITSNDVALLRRAIDCFKNQTYPSRELIIVYEDDNLSLIDALDDLREDTIRFYEVPVTPKLTLGELRNFGIEQANGEYFCQWDDDDWYHNRRIEQQMAACLGSFKDSSLLSNWIMFDAVGEDAYLSETRIWEGTILCRKDVFFNVGKYPSLNTSEDRGFVRKLFDQNLMYPVVLPNLYVYVYHGNNTWPKDHFELLFSKSQKLSRSFSLEIKKILDGAYSNDVASEVLSSRPLLLELNYFHSYL